MTLDNWYVRIHFTETENTEELNLARIQTGTQTQSKARLRLEPTVFLIKITHLVSGLAEVQVLSVSAQKEFSERQSDRQEIDLLR